MSLAKVSVGCFNPRAPEFRGKLWVSVTPAGAQPRLVIFWRRLLLCVLLAVLAGWLGLTGALHVYQRSVRGVAGARYLDLVLPTRWPAHRAALGAHLVQLGRDALARGEPLEALHHLATGVPRVADDSAAVRQLAILCLQFGRKEQAMQVLEQGLARGIDDLAHLRFSLGLLVDAGLHDRVIALADRHLPARPDQVLAHQFLALQQATAHSLRGRHDQATAIVATWSLERSLEGQLLLARADWERGYRELAVLRLQAQQPLFPGRDELPLQLIEWHRATGRPDLALQQAFVRLLGDPISPGPRIDVLLGLHATGATGRLHDGIRAYLDTFATDLPALLLLAEFAIEANLPALAQQVRLRASANGLPPAGFWLAEIRAQLAARNYSAALALADEAKQGGGATNRSYGALLAGLVSLAEFGEGNLIGGDGQLRLFLSHERINGADALFLARELEAAGLRARALHVLEVAARNDPADRTILTDLVLLYSRSGDSRALEANLPRLLALGTPSSDVLQEIATAAPTSILPPSASPTFSPGSLE